MKATDFTVVKRPTFAKIVRHPSIGFANYERRLKSMQSVMQSIQQAYLGTRERAVVVLEGWDTSGKGGIVRRLGWALDPRSFKVYPIAAPLSHERGRHYLQRFWEKLPDPGQIVVFDRSWYGRVLVERVEGFAGKHEWRRGYEEINEFERMMVADGIRIAKSVADIVVEELRKKEINGPIRLPKRDFFTRGQKLKVKDPWHILSGYDLEFAGMSTRERVRVMLEWFGRRQTPPHRFRFVGPVQQLLPNGRPVLLQIVAKLIDRHPVDARATFVAPHLPQCFLQVCSFTYFLNDTTRVGWAFGLTHRREQFDVFPSRLPGFTRRRR